MNRLDASYRGGGAVGRLLFALLGGYAFVGGLLTLAIPLLTAAGFGFEASYQLCMIGVFVVYTAVILWVAVSRRLVLAGTSLIVLGLICYVVGERLAASLA